VVLVALLNPLFLQAVTGDPEITYSAQDYRSVISTLAPNAGTVRENDLKVGPRAAGANMSVDVAAGKAIVQGTSVANQGTYIVQSTAVENVPLATADATNPRYDRIVAKVYDKQADGGSRYAWQPIAVTGTPSSSPSPPSTPANALHLATVYVPAGAVSITAADIIDRRVLSGTGDVPKWDFSGTPGTPQAIPNDTVVTYQPATRFQTVGVGSDPTLAKVIIRTPGRYSVHFGARFSPSTNSGTRYTGMVLYEANGTTRLREIAQETVAAGPVPVTAAGTVYIRAGEILVASMYQLTGQQLVVHDAPLTANFTGVWVGP
jgi:hypothetical protein